jgi:hypothetical protein
MKSAIPSEFPAGNHERCPTRSAFLSEPGMDAHSRKHEAEGQTGAYFVIVRSCAHRFPRFGHRQIPNRRLHGAVGQTPNTPPLDLRGPFVICSALLGERNLGTCPATEFSLGFHFGSPTRCGPPLISIWAYSPTWHNDGGINFRLVAC